MILSDETVAELIALGAPPEKVAKVLRLIERDLESATPKRSAAAERQARYRARLAQRSDATVMVVTESITENNENITEHNARDASDAPPRARVRDISPKLDTTGNLSLALAREWAGDALADMARAPGVASLHSLKAAMRGDNPCTLDDIEAGVRAAAAWHRSKGRKGAMGNWELAVKMAAEARDRRVSGAPPAGEIVPIRGTGPPSIADRIAAQNAEAERLAFAMLDAKNGRTK